MNKKAKDDLIGRIKLMKNLFGSPSVTGLNVSEDYKKGYAEALDNVEQLIETHYKRFEKGEYKK